MGVGVGLPELDVEPVTVTCPAALQLLASLFSTILPEESTHTRTAKAPCALPGIGTLALTDRRCPAASAPTENEPSFTREPAAGFQSTPPLLAPARAFPALRTTASTFTSPSATDALAETTTKSGRATRRFFATATPPATAATTTAAKEISATARQSLDRTPRTPTTLNQTQQPVARSGR